MLPGDGLSLIWPHSLQEGSKKVFQLRNLPWDSGVRQKTTDQKLKQKYNNSVEVIATLMTITPQCPVLTSFNRHKHLVTVVLISIAEVIKSVLYWSKEVLG